LCVAFLPRCRYYYSFKPIEKFLEDEFLLPTHQRKVCDPDSHWIGRCRDKGEEEKGFEHRHGNRNPHDIGLVDDFFFTRLAKRGRKLQTP